MKTTPLIDIPRWLPVFLAVALTACVPTTPRLDAQFGTSVSMARAQQTANPDASHNTSLVKGFDGQAADATVDNYRESFVNPRPAASGGIVSVGTSGASAGATLSGGR